MYHKTTLDNGLRILTSYMPHTHSVCIAIFIGVGSRYESDKEAGISHFIEHVSFRGTAKRPEARDISEAIEGVGGILNGATDKELTFYWCKVTQEHFAMATEVLADMLLNSNFKAEDIEKERQVIIEEINMGKDSPQQQVSQLIDSLLWPDHPLGRDIAGTKDSIAAIDRKALLKFLKDRYTPKNTLVTVAGNVKDDEVIKVVSSLMGSWSNPEKPKKYLSYKDSTGQRLLIENRDTEQAHICLALPGVSIVDDSRFSLDLLNVILGEGMSSRLFSEIRDKMGLAYSISSYVDHYLDSGSLTVSASVDPKNLNKAVKAILDQLGYLKDGVPESELNKARQICKGRMLLRMEDSRNVAGWLGGQEILLNRILSLEEIIEKINAVTTEQLTDIARRFIVPEQMRLAVVGPVKSDKTLRKLLKIK